ncbi:hypothetical protein BSK56_28730 [Paenibacillus borealis]|uniref:Uncharacterized protein n=1 Tax=Paenibacillus borealis TaxID=160799 RepID=A0ABX3H132_PAEBO|nr:hypothetical protein BSK56_28730 [Paenibacillus borealis]
MPKGSAAKCLVATFGLECDGYQSHVKDMDREIQLLFEPGCFFIRDGLESHSFLLRRCTKAEGIG